MTIAASEIDLVTNHIRIEVGPSKHLQPQDWSSMLQFFRYRRLYIDSAVRATGTGGASGQIDMALNTPDANTVPGLTLDQQLSFVAPDATASGVTNILQHDSTQCQINVTQQSTASPGTNYTTAIIPPIYSGSGSPSATSLAANAYYRVNHLYVDTSGNNLWRCTGAGSASSSTWAQISGAAISVGPYNNSLAYSPGSIVLVLSTITVGSITILPGTYVCAVATVGGATGNQIPQYPLPTSGTIYWYNIALGVTPATTCAGGTTATIDINATGTF